MDYGALIAFAAFIAVFGGIVWWAVRHERRQRAAIEALAAAEGWTIGYGREGAQPVATISPADGTWSLRLGRPFRRGSGKSSPAHPGSTELTVFEPAWPDGRVIFTQRFPGGFDRLMGGSALAGLASLLQNAALARILDGVVPAAVAADLPRMKPFDPPPGVELAILATEDPRGGDLAAVHAAVHGWTPVRSRDRSPPSLAIGPEGTVVRLAHCLTAAEDIALFVRHGLAVAVRLAASGRG